MASLSFLFHLEWAMVGGIDCSPVFGRWCWGGGGEEVMIQALLNCHGLLSLVLMSSAKHVLLSKIRTAKKEVCVVVRAPVCADLCVLHSVCVCAFVCLSVCRSFSVRLYCLFVYYNPFSLSIPSVCLTFCLSVCLSVSIWFLYPFLI